MFVLWSSDVSPYRTDSVSSRFPIAIIPASLYVINDEGVNVTLQSMTQAVTSSFNKLSTHGVKLRDFLSMGGATAF